MNPNQPYNPQPGMPGQMPPNYQGPAGPYVPPSPYGQPAPYGPPPSPYGPPPPVMPGQVPPYGQPAPGPHVYDPFADLRADPYGPPPKKSGGAGKAIAIAIVVIALIGLVVALVAAGSTGQPQTGTPKTAEPQTAIFGDVISRPDGTLDLSKRVDTATSIKSQSVQAKVKEQVNLVSGFSFLVKDVGTYESSTAKPAAGKQFIIMLVTVGNRADKEDISVSYLDFKLLDNKNNLLTGHPATQQILNNLLSSPTQLKPGEQLEGRLVFEVDGTDSEWSLVHKETYERTTDKTTFTVEGKIAVDIGSERGDSADPSQAESSSGTATPPASPSPGAASPASP